MNNIITKTLRTSIGATLLFSTVFPIVKATAACMDFDSISTSPFISHRYLKPFEEPILKQNGIVMYLDTYTRGYEVFKNRIEINQPWWASSNLLRLQNAAVSFYFDFSLLGFYPREISFKYYDIKDRVNIRIDDFLYNGEMPANNTTKIGRVKLEASGSPAPAYSLYGTVHLKDHDPYRNVGMQAVLIGGEYLLIDDVCVNP